MFKVDNLHFQHLKRKNKTKQKTVKAGLFCCCFVLDTINVINVKLSMMLQIIKLYLVILLSVALAVFQGHSFVKQFYLKMVCS